MILTGKAREDFEKIYYPPISRSEIYENALIIEWLDSVGIYIEIIKEDFGFALNIHTGDWKNPDESIGHWLTRQEATKQAIIKANEIYNERNTI